MNVSAVPVPFLDLKAQYHELRTEMNSAIMSVLESANFIGGPVVGDFEREFATWIGAKHCVAVANGTDAIMLAVRAAGLKAGDEVLIPANTFFATAEAISNARATPVFVDVDPATFHMDPCLVEEAITERTRAIVPVHLYGRAVNMAPIEKIAQRYGLILIEDCAQAHGAVGERGRIGSSGRLTCFSFYPGKNLGAYGDGGAITTDDEALAGRLRILREHGSPVKYQHREVGWNSRLDAIQAAVLSTKLQYLDGWNAARRAHAHRYHERLRDFPLILPELPQDAEHVFHLFVVRCALRDELKSFLEERGIQTGIHYPVPLHLTPAYQDRGAPGRGSKPISEALAAEILSLPMFPELIDCQIERVVAAIRDFVDKYRPALPERTMTIAETV